MMGSSTSLAIFQELADDLAGRHVTIRLQGGHWVVPSSKVSEREQRAAREAAVALLVPPDVVAIGDGAQVLEDFCLEPCPEQPETCCNPAHVGLRVKCPDDDSP